VWIEEKMSTEEEIEIVSELQEPEELKQMIEQAAGSDAVLFNLQLRRLESIDRSVDAAVLVALISGGTAALVALINVIGPRLGPKGVIKLQLKNGDEVDYPANLSPDQIKNIVEIHRKLGVKGIKVVKSPKQ
jgi:hypothetical protein